MERNLGQALKSKSDLSQLLIDLGSQGETASAPSKADVTSGAASWMHWRLVSMMTDFESDLSDDEEMALQIPGRPADQPFYLETVAFWNPDMIVLSGTDTDRAPLRHAHHVSQLGYTLIGAPKIHATAVRISEALIAGLPET